MKAKSRKKRIAVAIVLGTVVAAAVFASAASLAVNPKSLGAGGNVVASCDTDGVGVDYTTAFDAANATTANGGYKVSEVKVTGLAAGCANHAYKVQFVGGTAPSFSGTFGGTIDTTAETLTIGAGNQPWAKDLTNVYVVISG
jgi:hypothetical protein